MQVIFAEFEARDGTDLTDVISVKPPLISGSAASSEIVGSDFAESRDLGNKRVSIELNVPYQYKDYGEATRGLWGLINIFSKPRTAQLKILDSDTVFTMENTVCSVKFPEEIIGCFFEVACTFTGGETACKKLGYQ